MKKFLSVVSLLFFVSSFFLPTVYAVEDPLAVPNNKIGIHLLFDSEIDPAAKLVNGHGGDWGYVTIPIQATDMDLVKWQKFMDKCQQLHVIPIIRLATYGDYFKTSNWQRPTYDDIIDFANFLNALNWPTKNRYVIVYNEVNRGDEWGGSIDPAGYASLLEYAVKEFKFVNPDFFIIAAGLDNAAPTQGTDFENEYQYYRDMNQAVPNIFSQIDGMSSHAYPNPGFASPPSVNTRESIYSFQYEQSLLQTLGSKKLPVFITETGWQDDIISDSTIANYYQQALTHAWSDPSIVAITPFLLSANQGGFTNFSFLKPDGSESHEYQFIKDLSKVKGQPILNSKEVLSAATDSEKDFNPQSKYFSPLPEPQKKYPSLSQSAKAVFSWIFKLH